jgi:hypothetical protein
MQDQKPFAQKRSEYILYKQVSWWISIILQPLLMPSIFFAIVVWRVPSLLGFFEDAASYWFLMVVFVTTGVVPLLMLTIIVFVTTKKLSIKALFMDRKEERPLPFLITGVYFTALAYMFQRQLDLSGMPLIFLLLSACAILAVALISQFWKVSAHVTAMAGLTAFLGVIDYFHPENVLTDVLCSLIIGTAILMSARLYLRAHDTAQVFGGLFLGCLIGLGGYLFLSHG